MKKVILFLLTLTVLTTQARNINLAEAQAIADEFVNARQAAKPNRAPRQMKAVEQASNDAYYVFNSANGNGFVIVSADDRIRKVLGYSDNGSFNAFNMPPQLNAMLDGYAKQLAQIPEAAPTHKSWESPSRTEGNGVLLQTANWGQGAPYNSECPIIDEIQAPTGCVATAMAIVMDYNKWPEAYDWAVMAADPTATATLMKDAGAAVYMSYGADESGANMNWVGHMLQQKFTYSPDCQYITKKNFNDNQWETIIIENLNDGQPIIYSGDNGAVGHAFIVDGYDADGLYHINWGWDGNANGYYALDATEYADNQGMVINIEPDRSGKQYSRCFVDYGYFWGSSSNGINMSVENIETNVPFDFFSNIVTFPYGTEGYIGLGLIDKNDIIKEVIKPSYFSTLEGDAAVDMATELSRWNCQFSSPVSDTDRIQIVTRERDHTDWRLVLGTIESPSWVSVKGFSPRYATINVFCDINNIGLRITTAPYEDHEIHTSPTTLKSLIGNQINITPYATTNHEENGIVHIDVEGRLPYGDEHVSGELGQCGHTFYPIDGSYNVRVSFVKDKDFISDLTIHNGEAGKLQDNITLLGYTPKAITGLKLSGSINAVDFWYIRDNLTSLQSLDLSNVVIEACKATNNSFLGTTLEIQPADYIPEWGLSEMHRMQELTLPSSLMGISSNALTGLSISQIVIPNQVANIGDNAMYGCSNLEYVICLSAEPIPIQDCIFTGTKCPTEGVLYVPAGSKTKYTTAPVWDCFPQIIDDDSYEYIGRELEYMNFKFSFRGHEAQIVGYVGNLGSLSIPETVVADSVNYAVTSIAPRAFADCTSLTSISLNRNIRSIGEQAFINCSNLTTINMESSITDIPLECFRYCTKLKDFEIPETVTHISGWALFGCASIETIKLSKYVGYDEAFPIFGDNHALQNISVDEANPYMTSVDGVLYSKDRRTLLAYPMGRDGSYTIPDGTETIGYEAMSGAKYLTEIVMPQSLNVIHHGAFFGCSNMNSFTIKRDIIFPSGDIFDGETGLTSISVNDFHFSGRIGVGSALERIYLSNTTKYFLTELWIHDEWPRCAVYSNSLTPNFSIETVGAINIPGATTEYYDEYSHMDVREMWMYRINRTVSGISITPVIEDIAINEVKINDVVTEGTDGKYFYEPSVNGLDVEVTYTLHGRHQMTTHYTPDFNSAISDSELQSDISEIYDDNHSIISVFNFQGMKLFTGKRNNIPDLTPGAYIMYQGTKTEKIIVK